MSRFPSLPWDALGKAPWTLPAIAGTSTLPERCEFAIVGAGLTGLSCALTLASGGRDVVVIERAFGAGATCRSGGIIAGDTLVGPAPGFDACEFELRDWIERNAARCALNWTGCAELDRDLPRGVSPIAWSDAGVIHVTRMAPGGIVDPAALLGGVAAAAMRAGVAIVNGATAQGWRRDGDEVAITTSAGRLLAKRVLVAIDATDGAPGIDPWPERFLTVVLETEPLTDETAAAIGWSARFPFYTNDLPLLWGRAMPGGGMMAGRELIGGRLHDRDAIGRAISEATVRLTARIRGLHPALATIGVRRSWAGPIARDTTGVPAFVADSETRGVWWAGGYGGHGLAQAFRLGATAARMMLS